MVLRREEDRSTALLNSFACTQTPHRVPQSVVRARYNSGERGACQCGRSSIIVRSTVQPLQHGVVQFACPYMMPFV